MENDVRVVLGLPRFNIEATDGWYSIPLAVDGAMTNYILNGKIKEGTKIITYGSELLNCERGFFPLDVTIHYFTIDDQTYNFAYCLI